MNTFLNFSKLYNENELYRKIKLIKIIFFIFNSV